MPLGSKAHVQRNQFAVISREILVDAGTPIGLAQKRAALLIGNQQAVLV